MDLFCDILNFIGWHGAWLVYIRCYCCTSATCLIGCLDDEVPDQIQVDISGVVNGTVCSDCALFNTTYILDIVFDIPTLTCDWQETFAALCAMTGVIIRAASTSSLEVSFGSGPAPGQAIFSKSFTVNEIPCNSMNGESIPLSFSSPGCDWTPSTCLLTSL